MHSNRSFIHAVSAVVGRKNILTKPVDILPHSTGWRFGGGSAQPTPARFNANPNYLYETSGSAGKLSVFAIRLDTFPAPKQKQLFYLATNTPNHLNKIRRHMLGEFDNLPIIAEYLNEAAYVKSRDYARDVYAILQIFGPRYMPQFFRIKRKTDAYFKKVKIFGNAPLDKFLQFISKPCKIFYPKRLLQMGKKYKHHLFIEMSDVGIGEAQQYFDDFVQQHTDISYIACTEREHKAVVYFRFATGNGLVRFETMQQNKNLKVLAFDVAYPRNTLDTIGDIIPPEIDHALCVKNHVSHFFCHVTHQGYLVDTSKCDYDTVRDTFVKFFAQKNAVYPAEHNFGNKNMALENVQEFYKNLDPCNSFNAGVGCMSKHKYYE